VKHLEHVIIELESDREVLGWYRWTVTLARDVEEVPEPDPDLSDGDRRTSVVDDSN
jgi:hypothetical protein